VARIRFSPAAAPVVETMLIMAELRGQAAGRRRRVDRWLREAQAAFPATARPLLDVGGFKAALIIAAALCLATAVVSFVLPGRPSSPARALTGSEVEDLEVLMQDQAELSATGLAAVEEPLASGSGEDRP